MPRFLSRRSFLFTGAAVGGTALVAAVGGVGYLATVDMDGPDSFVDGNRAVLNAFVAVHADGRVVIQAPRTEMGQGIHTGLAMLVAEELDIPFDDLISVEHPVEQLAVYANYAAPLRTRPEDARGPIMWAAKRALGLLPLMNTAGSSSTMGLWFPMRVAGAAARHMLVTAGAARLGVPVGELTTSDGFVHHGASHRSIPYGALARDAAAVPPPREPALRPASAWRLIGRSQPRVDLPGKVRGEPVFGADVVLPNMLHAAIRQAPVFGAGVARLVNAAEVRAQPGVIDVAVIDGRSVAVVAGSWWQAEAAARRLDVQWTRTEADGVTSAGLAASLHAALDSDDPYVHLVEGDVEAGFRPGAARVVEATYTAPFLTHACMEPMNATAIIHGDGAAEAWCPSQSPLFMRWGVNRGAGLANVDPSSVTCHITMNGGAFGRRTDMDVVVQAAFLAARHRGRPVKLMWSREEDIGRGVFRSHAAARLRAALGPDGLPIAYDARVAAQAMQQSAASRNLPFGNGGSARGDRFTLEGLDKAHYSFPNRRVRSQHVPSHMPIGAWRSNGFSFNTFFAESFVDECAAAAGADPVAYRRALLRDSPRHLAVLNRVAALAGWGMPMPPGRGRGIAIEEAYESVVAQVAEVTVAADGEVTVDRVFCAIDVGIVVNPDAVAAQMEGGILFGVTTALMSAITIEDGAVVESNFHDFPMQRLRNAPEVVVEMVPSDLPPGGAGEPGIVPVAAAIANAIHAATGRRLRSLPLAVTETIGERRTRSVLRENAA
ncbi:xanthine dehydrogenase family protein molybdopterin-binding subunit [Plastoroseomonas hellenica]|uniref:xanthine dehydrogenase family protein molybdopterin-binding subunit n=1 Tax=Plastoroseomonas hellenica TaxID=2687306 RepID=UPI001BA45B38|nr:molybdopterin cofactor-binding domain-containing protein [Plastoroseomonas hellenica]MBR0641916.1 xanthine dehydrogenase family protein molybdopterin-binding subunit [Plastoroseomonas hellenica]